MKRKFPIASLIVVLSVALIYVIRFSFVSDCQDLIQTQNISGEEITYKVIEDKSEEDNEITDNNQLQSGKVHWWKAGITEYELMEEIMTEPVEIETTQQATTAQTTTEETTTQQTTTAQTTTEETTTQQTTTAQTTTEETTTQQTTTAQSTTEETTTEPPQTPSTSSWGTITVKDTYTGKVIADDAYDIVCQVVHNEVGTLMQEEAIKAQAIAAYSYIKFYNNKGTTPQISLKPYPSQKIKNCVSAVSGLAAYYNGKVALTTFSASTAGSTADSKDVWGTSYPYLASVESKYDNLDMNYGRTKTYSESTLKSKLESYFGITLSSNPNNWISIQSRLSGNLVGTVSIDGQTTTTGRKLRESVLSYGIRSASFDISYSNGTFTFTTYGYGHGVGMPQNGANLYAYYEGWNYQQILTHYYTGVEIK